MAEEKGKVTPIVFVAVIILLALMVVVMLSIGNRATARDPTENKTTMCIERLVSPCEDSDCGAYNYTIFEQAVDCTEWAAKNQLGHDAVSWCIEKFQRLDGNCTKYVEYIDMEG